MDEIQSKTIKAKMFSLEQFYTILFKIVLTFKFQINAVYEYSPVDCTLSAS